MRDLAQELRGMPLLLQRIGVVRATDDIDVVGGDFPALALALGSDERAAYYYRGAGGEALHGRVIGQRVPGDDLKIAQAGAVVQFNERKILRITPGPHPALDLDGVDRGSFTQRFLY